MKPINPQGDVVAQLQDSIVLLAHEAQGAFAERYGQLPWRADLADVPVLWFESEPRAVFRAHFIGSVAGASNTWLWGWENINRFPDAAVATSHSVRELGEQAAVPLLTTASLSLAGAGDALVHSLVRCAMAVSGIPTYYRAPTGPDSFAWFLVDNPEEFSLGQPDPLATTRVIAEVLGAGLVTEPRRALADYAERRGGIAYDESDDGLSGSLALADAVVSVRFDELGRVTELTTTAHGGR